ncbi:hypothetical protein [Shewanella gelidii]|uniref:Uncharacterized protein n=1 Tax=Shewanella gelidii TaxID=1642821 RepID=A0A917JZR8_9GAMM|nr:hypothetical protein [Shewanella gelidii]MCL1099357.1 hypothetical protein [Shewanella gelidii]GGI92261.1 hypothetical protein GCM10009332_31960 [Shewanella gelidii]
MRLLVFCLLFSCNTFAWCEMKTELTQVSFNQNSSYFNSLSTQQLDTLLQQFIEKSAVAEQEDPVFVLEYKLNQASLDQESFKYNRWLADRRISRVKDYLATQLSSTPIVSQINTASAISDRSVTIQLCHNSALPSGMLAAVENLNIRIK